MDSDKKNLVLAMILSVAILFGWNFFFPSKREAPRANVEQTTHSNTTAPQVMAEVQPLVRNVALEKSTRLKIATDKVTGSIALKGARFDDITLEQYHETTAPRSEKIHLLSPGATAQPYFADFGWVSDDKTLKLPDTHSLWTADRDVLQVNQPLTLSWDNGEGLIFQQIISIDENYLFSISQRVQNNTDKAVQLATYGSLYRALPESVSDFFILHEGPIGYLGNKLIEHKYKDIKEKLTQSYNSTGGWLGITDKYWLSALIPDQGQPIKVTYRFVPQNSHERYQVDYLAPTQTVAPQATLETKTHLFAGAKVLSLLDHYEEKLGVKHFDLAVDFGWYYIITKPIFHILTYTKDWLGNFGLAIMLLTVLLKALFFPLANKSYRSMARMKEMQPKMEKLKERFQHDRIKMNQEMMELYKREKINPMAGCLPMIVQIPVFFALYKVLFVTIEMRHAPFFGWITDLSAPDPTSLFNLFGLIPWTPPSFLMIGIWPLIMGVTMFAQQKLNPPPADPAQAKMFMLMPVVFTFMLAQFPAGLVIYWAWNNVLSIIQQWSIMRLSAKKQKLVR
jgi:YidC/Oxa1 family membrane protein insertase